MNKKEVQKAILKDIIEIAKKALKDLE